MVRSFALLIVVGIGLPLAAVTALAQAPAAPAHVSADATPAAPALTDLQKLQVQNLAQRLELTQTQIRAAQLDYERTAQALTALVQALQVPGYELNLQTLEYAQKKEPAKPADKATPPK